MLAEISTQTGPKNGGHILQYCGLAWAMAHPYLQSLLVRHYGDRRLVAEQYEASRRWLELVQKESGFIIREGLSDHESLERTETAQLVTPLYHQAARIVSSLARLLGRSDYAVRHAGLAEAVRSAYFEQVLPPAPDRYEALTQAGLAAALELGIFPDGDRAAAERALVRKVESTQGPHVTAGIFGTKFVLTALSGAGRADLAFELVARREYPGWGYMIKRGATTLWEHWDFSDNTFSHNHPMFGSVSEWLFSWLAGIQPAPDAVGFDRIIIRPQPVGDLTWVKGGVQTARGEVRSDWRIEKGRFLLDVAVPPNTKAVVHLPGTDPAAVLESGRPASAAAGVRILGREAGAVVLEIGSGRYRFASPWPAIKSR